MRIAAFGDINIDVVLAVDRLPRLGEEVFSTTRTELLGGSAVNTGVVLARLGHDVAMMGAVGDDDSGRRALSLLEEAGVDTRLTRRSAALPTAMNTVIVTPDGERTMIGARGANTSYTAPPGWQEGFDWLHVSGYSLMEGIQRDSALEVIETGQLAGVPISLDVPTGVGRTVGAGLTGSFAALTVVTGNRSSLGELTGSDQPVDHLMDAGVKRVAMTSGADPLVLAIGPGRISLTPPHVDPVDATGAGDALAAGLIAATLAGMEIGPSAVLAAGAGAAATLVTGASATLAADNVWTGLLQPGLWKDARPEWLDTVRDAVTR